jgi:metallo-beta-lactamase family protein
MSIRFLGATGTVTGSKFLVTTPESRVLVDCGLFQGLKELRLRNRQPLAEPPATIDAVVVTHAHLDHTGYLPRLVADGFTGTIHATEDTTALASIVLPDSGHLQEEEADYANRMGFSRHRPAVPLYTEADARWCLGRFTSHAFGESVPITDDLTATFRPAGHILGSAHVQLMSRDGLSVVFSGDLGRPNHPLLVAPEPPPAADALVIESTYGDREHVPTERLVRRLVETIRRSARTGGVVVIPAFAVDRTEMILHHLDALAAEHAIPQLPVFVDSPMALAALRVYRRALTERHPDLRSEPPASGEELFGSLDLREVKTVEDSKRLNSIHYPCIIVSASGMASGGRVVHHLAHRLDDPDSAVVLAGFQAAGTRGRRLLDGERAVKMLGRYVRVRAQIVDVTDLSSHADRGELRRWVEQGPRPGAIFVVHGEQESAAALQHALEQLDVPVVVPGDGERVTVVRTAQVGTDDPGRGVAGGGPSRVAASTAGTSEEG